MGGATRPWRPPVLPRLPKLFQTTSLSQWRRRKLKTRKKRKNKERNKEDGNYCELTPKTSARISIEEELKIGRDDDCCTMVHGAWCTMVHGAPWCPTILKPSSEPLLAVAPKLTTMSFIKLSHTRFKKPVDI